MARRHHRIRSCMMARETSSLVQTPDPAIPPDSYKHEIHSSAGFEPLRPHRRRGWHHFEALLLELSFHIVHKPYGCRLMQGTFAMSADQAASSIRRCWGARLTWTTQRAHAMNYKHCLSYAIARMEHLLSDFYRAYRGCPRLGLY